MPGRDHHGGEGEVGRGHGVVVAGHASAACAHIAHLGAAVARVKVGLELERIPVVAAGCKAGDPALQPGGKVLTGRLQHAALDIGLRRDSGVHQAALIKDRLVGGGGG